MKNNRMVRLGVLAVLLTIIVRRCSAGHFSCDNLATASCSCSAHSLTLYELLCPLLTVQIKLNESVQLQCTSDSLRFSELSGLHIGDVERFVLRLCPLPGISIRKLMAGIGIQKISMLQIQSYNILNDTLLKEHFEKLYEVTNLSLNNNGLTSLPKDIFEDMGNLTWLDMKYNYIDLPREIFHFTPKLEVLELGKNNLTHLKPGIFKNLERLRLLNLWGNKLKNLTRAIFSDVPNLESLDLNSNDMETIRPDLFADLLKLKKLNLHANAFVSLPQGLFSRNLELEELQMHENKRSLVSLPLGFLSNLMELKMIRLSSCKLTSLPEDTFMGSKNINSIYLNRNQLNTLPEELFFDLEQMEFLDLSQNLITYLPEGLFKTTKKLKVLKLHYNQMIEIHPRLFSYLSDLEYLDLRFNELKEIKADQFYYLEKLKALNISDNQLTTLAADAAQMPELSNSSVLCNCKNLEDLQLANNSLTEIYDDWKELKLHTLNLAFNHIHSIKAKDLAFIGYIDLSNNNITSVEFWQTYSDASLFVKGTKPKHIKMNNNPFNCDCQLLTFVQFVKNIKPTEAQSVFDIPVENLKCNEPQTLTKIPLKYVPLELLTCEIKSESYICPTNCTCHYRSLDKGNVINCQNKSLVYIPPSLPLYMNATYTELNLEGNQLDNVEIPKNKGYGNVTYFNLSNNNITALHISGLSRKIKKLDLSNNNLSRLNSETTSFLQEETELETLVLNGNPWQCDCEAKPLILLLKDKYKKVKNVNNVTCPDGILLSDMNENDLCNENTRILIIVCVICAILGFLLAFLTALYYHYEREIHIYCFSSRWKLLRWLVSHPDSDLDKKYDAFISFSHQDEQFVMEKLLPELEKKEDNNYKLCVHVRDFIPGESIPNQILSSIKDSRRTIVVLSPDFLKSMWGQLEFRTAVGEAQNDGIARVIVIMYKDVGSIDDLDEDLKAYLKLNTYLKWDSPWFWQQLYYALPHPSEDADNLKCLFCKKRFPRVNEDSSSHEILRNVQVSGGGDVHLMSNISQKVNDEKPTGIKSRCSIIEDADTKPKHISSGNQDNGTISNV